MFLAELQQNVLRLKGIGKGAAADLAHMGIHSIGSLLTHYPLRYDDRKTPRPLSEAAEGVPVNTRARVIAHEWINQGYKKTLKVIVEDDTATAALVCFGRNFLERRLSVGTEIFLCGTFNHKYGELQTGAFEFEEVSDHPKDFGAILPVYALSGSLQQKALRKAIRQALNDWALNIDNELPPSLLRNENLSDKAQALRQIHIPRSLKEIAQARDSLIREELLHLQLTIGRNALAHRTGKSTHEPLPRGLQKRFIEGLPFTLTEDQSTAVETILDDMNSGKIMNRLVQGEVGSGKTLVAFLAALPVIEGGGQVAMMAPTELLARQHGENAARQLEPLGIRLAFLSGQIGTEERRLLLQELREGRIDLIMGTHALFTEDVLFKNLRLVIVDEQHRFGVKQRLSLAEKGDKPDLLLMTATPIPRTLSLTAFGDLDISSIKTMPRGRKPIMTHLAKKGNEFKVYDFVHGELAQGRQAYFVYPLIEQSDKMSLKDAETMFRFIDEKAFPTYRCALIHSRIPEEEKRASMAAFARGEVDILVATSVVEVGVDVPNATVMVVEQAERFGLSALHQLRGRVGRGEHQSYCFLVFDEGLTEEGKQRMMIMKENRDGFVIAEEDLKLRGMGDITGSRQSGFMKLAIADLIRDREILLWAREETERILRADPGLLSQENLPLRELFNRVPPFDSELISQG
ncbi:MAG: ATP-dependent DNA helicase RecG [Spirochaetales bacterium]|nr:ATP-dependent DNA helicase RecG [Spirochaetales bacterium]